MTLPLAAARSLVAGALCRMPWAPCTVHLAASGHAGSFFGSCRVDTAPERV